MNFFTGWLLYNKKDATENKSYINWFISEAKKQNISLHLVYRETLTISIEDGVHITYKNGNKVLLPHFVVFRTMDSLLNVHFEKSGVLTFNPSGVSIVSNRKDWTHFKVNELNIPMVNTYFFSKYYPPPNPPLPFPFVLKETTGRGGKQVYYISSLSEWSEVMKDVQQNDIIIQEVNIPVGIDIRVFVIGKEIIAAVMRKSESDFRANFKLGGKAIPFTLSAQQKATVQKIVNHFDFGLVGIDFLLNEDGQFIFNEIEDVAGSRILSAVSDINLLEKYVAYIKNRLIENVPFS